MPLPPALRRALSTNMPATFVRSARYHKDGVLPTVIGVIWIDSTKKFRLRARSRPGLPVLFREGGRAPFADRRPPCRGRGRFADGFLAHVRISRASEGAAQSRLRLSRPASHLH